MSLARKTILGLAVGATCLVIWPGLMVAQTTAPASQPAARPAAPASLLPANWQTLSLGDLAAVSALLANAGNDHAADRGALAAYVYTAYLSQPKTLTPATPDQAVTLLMVATPHLNDRQRAVVRNTLFQRFPANSPDVPSLSLPQVAWLTGSGSDALAIPASQSQTWVQSWMDGHQGGQSLSLADALDAGDMIVRAYDHQLKPMPASLQTLVQSVVQNTNAWDQAADVKVVLQGYGRLQGWTTEAQRLTLQQYVWGRITGNVPQAAAQLDWKGIAQITDHIMPGLKLRTPDIAPLIASFLTTQASTLPPNTLSVAALTLSEVRHDPALEGVCAAAYQAVAQTLVTRLAAPDPITGPVAAESIWLGLTFETDAQRQQLRDIISAAGNPLNRLDAGKILAYGCKYAGQLPDFKKEAAGHTADPQLDGDTKALWMLLAGEAERVTPADPDEVRKRAWMDKAYAAAQSEALRLLILQEYTTYFNAVAHPALGASLMASVQGQFSEAAAVKVREMKASLETAQANQQVAVQARAQAAAKTRQAALLKYYQASLQRAQADKDQGAVARIQGAIADLQSQINQSKSTGQ